MSAPRKGDRKVFNDGLLIRQLCRVVTFIRTLEIKLRLRDTKLLTQGHIGQLVNCCV